MDEKVLKLDRWKSCVSFFPEHEDERFRIRKTKYKKGYYHMYSVGGYLFFRATEPLDIVELQEKVNGKWKDWMVDDPPHYFAMQMYAKSATGNVLVTGLGLGMIVIELLKNKRVTKITVVEQSKEVIALISPFIGKNDKLEYVVDDFYDYIQNHHNIESRDMIVVDLWVTNGYQEGRKKLIEEVLPLRTFLQHFTNPEKTSLVFHGFMDICDVDIRKCKIEYDD
jgi:hypothetical protein